MISVGRKNQIILLTIPSEVFLGVVNDVVCSNRARLIQIPRTTHSCNFGAEQFGDLHRKCPHTTRGAINQNLLPWLNLACVAQTLQGSESSHGYSRGFRKRQISRFQRQSTFRSTCILGKTAMTNISEYLITWLKLLDVFANRFHLPGYVSAESGVLGLEQPPTHQANQEYVGCQEVPVILIYGRRVNFDQDFIILGRRFFYILELNNIR